MPFVWHIRQQKQQHIAEYTVKAGHIEMMPEYIRLDTPWLCQPGVEKPFSPFYWIFLVYLFGTNWYLIRLEWIET